MPVVPVRRESTIFTIVVASVAALAAIPMGVMLLVSGAPGTVLLASVLAFVPVAPLVAAYLWLDRYEPEPRVLLGLGLAWGAFVATLVALVAQVVGAVLLGFTEEGATTILAPVTEEASKGAFLLLLLLWRRNELDGVLDGIVYAGMVGIGFAFTENILYLGMAYTGADGAPGGLAGLTSTFIVRCLASPFAHPAFTAFLGIAVGLAISSRSWVARIVLPLGGYVLAVLGHAAWNTSATVGGGEGFIAAYVIVMVPVFLLLVAFAIWVRGRERILLWRALHDAAGRGFLPHAHIPHVVDLRSRSAARRYAGQYGGAVAQRSMRAYQQAAVELGYLHHRYLRGTAPRDFVPRGQGYVDRLRALSPAVVFPPAPPHTTNPPTPHVRPTQEAFPHE